MKGQKRGDRFKRSFEEIAAELGMTRQNVELIYERAIGKLRNRKPDGLHPSLQECLEEPRFLPPSPKLQMVKREAAPVEVRSYEYRDWDEKTTRVVSGPYGCEHKNKFPGRRFPDRRSARLYWEERAGVVEEYMVPGRYIFRVRIEKPIEVSENR